MNEKMPSSIALSHQRCLIFGGSGFIGTNLCRALSGQVRTLKIFSSSPAVVDGVEWIEGDFLNSDDIDSAVDDVDIVFHLISTSTPASSNADPLADARQNILQTLRMLDACRIKQVKRVVFISSGGTIYGDAKIFPTPESHPERPICAYGISKLAIERYLGLYERLYGITGISLRVSNPYGPYQHSAKNQGVVAAFISRALAGQPIEIWGDGSVVRDYVYVEDVVEAILRAATYTGSERTFNIGSGKGICLTDIADAVAQATGLKLNKIFKASRSVDVTKSVLDCSRAKTELGWSSTHSLEQGIDSTVYWMRARNIDS